MTPSYDTAWPRPRPADAALGEVEALMAELAGDGDPAGRIAREHLSSGGKRLRARLALAALEALGGARAAGVAWAAACELLHNATLVHDDLQDGDRTRRGRTTAWVRHGAAQAINAGDLLLMLPYLAIERVPDAARRWALAAALSRSAVAVVRGQSAEMALACAPRVGWDDYLAAVEGKTGALFRLPVEGAALLAGLGPEEARELAAGFRGLGVLFQLQDDVLDLYGEKGRSAPGGDLREGKPSALVVAHLGLHPEDGPWLRGLLALPRDATPQAEVDRAIRRFRTGGALAEVLARIRTEARALARGGELAAEPALRAMARETTSLALAPIRHLTAARRETSTAAPALAVAEAV